MSLAWLPRCLTYDFDGRRGSGRWCWSWKWFVLVEMGGKAGKADLTGEFILHGCSGYSAGQGLDLPELELECQCGHGDERGEW